MKIKTNHVPRLLLDWNQLTLKEQEEFSNLRSLDRETGDYVRYRKWIYCVTDFTSCHHISEFSKWDGYQSDSYFSGVVCKYTKDRDHVIMGEYYE